VTGTRSVLIVVLHYSGLDDTVECLESLRRQTYQNIHTIVIDNGSLEKPGAFLEARYPWAEVLDLAENRGWSGGNNAGIRVGLEQDFDVICLLNNDTVLPDDAVERLMQAATFLGPCMLHPAIDSYGDDREIQLDPTIPQPPNLKSKPVSGYADLFEISSIYGACVFIDREIFQRIGSIDERFFLLCEDADFGERAIAAGYGAFCEASVRIQHKESRSFGGRRKPIKTYYGTRNLLLFSEKHDAGWHSILGFGRKLVWTAWGTAEATGAEPRSLWGLACWVFSDNSFARATRMAVRDYLLRRFGRLNQRDEAALSAKAGGSGR
jgi:GT2 family glycosyltransferase